MDCKYLPINIHHVVRAREFSPTRAGNFHRVEKFHHFCLPMGISAEAFRYESGTVGSWHSLFELELQCFARVKVEVTNLRRSFFLVSCRKESLPFWWSKISHLILPRLSDFWKREESYTLQTPQRNNTMILICLYWQWQKTAFFVSSPNSRYDYRNRNCVWAPQDAEGNSQSTVQSRELHPVIIAASSTKIRV